MSMNKQIYRDRVAALRALMAREGIDAYLIVTDDFHASEYVDRYFKCREYISGFTGSAGSLVITADEAGLWTDGRYFLQAAEQLEGTGIRLMKMREPETPTIEEYLAETLTDGQCLGYDGRTINTLEADGIKALLCDRTITYRENVDLVGELWTDRPLFPAKPAWLLPERYTGRSRAAKLADLRAALKQEGADRILITSLDDTAYLYNLRGSDVMFNPVAMAYTMVSASEAVLYIAPEAVSDEVRAELERDGVTLRPYLQVYADAAGLADGETLMLSRANVNVALSGAIPAKVAVLDLPNPTTLAKAVKTSVEMDNIREAHVQDGVAVVKLLSWLDDIRATDAYRKGEITELDVSDRLLAFRQERPGFLDQSFDPIVGSGYHGAIIHYEPTQESNIPLVDNSFLLMDTGGQYWQGTTDITRTVAMGELTEVQKRHFTAVLRGNLDLAAAVFKKGTTGVNLDLLARQPLWELGLDYNHGTGHGVGYLLNVHEGPQGIRLKDLSGTMGTAFEAGMLTSNEPGVYLEGEYGIRCESLMLCVEREKTDCGTFLGFETVTMVPYDRRAILPSELSDRELAQLNAYHAEVWEKISPYLNEHERAWLSEAAAPIVK